MFEFIFVFIYLYYLYLFVFISSGEIIPLIGCTVITETPSKCERIENEVNLKIPNRKT